MHMREENFPFLFSDILKGAKSFRAEKLVKIDFPSLAPIRPIWGPCKIPVVVGGVLPSCTCWAGSKNLIMGSQELSSHVWR